MKRVDVLIIEPSKDLALVVSQALNRKEISSVIANSAQSAIVQADKFNPKMIIIELLMPKHNGLEFIYEFRSYDEWLNVPIIIYSQIAAQELDAPKDLLHDMGVVEHYYKATTSLEALIGRAGEILE